MLLEDGSDPDRFEFLGYVSNTERLLIFLLVIRVDSVWTGGKEWMTRCLVIF